MAVLPPIDEVPDHFSATTLWNFRLASLGVEAVLWTALGLAFGILAEYRLSPARRAGPAAAPSLR
jgi:Probable cobalt transporter subunit (CbtA)